MVFLFKVGSASRSLSPDAAAAAFGAIQPPFDFFFREVAKADAHHQVIPNGEGVWIWIDMPAQAQADEVIGKFLDGWNEMAPTLQAVVQQKSALRSQGDDQTMPYSPR